MKSKSYIALAVTILLLLLLGGKVNNTTATANGGEENEVLQAEQKERKVGLGNHILKKDKVLLAEGSRDATSQEDYEKYMKPLPDACDVEFDEENEYIIISYSKNSKAAQNGCTLDLSTASDNEIEFKTFLKNDNNGGPKGCVKIFDKKTLDSYYNDNVLPFAYSHPTALENLKEGPMQGKSGEGCNSKICLENTCIEKTALELRWNSYLLDSTLQLQAIRLMINPIGSPSAKSTLEDMKKFSTKPVYPTVKVERTKYSVQPKVKPFLPKGPECEELQILFKKGGGGSGGGDKTKMDDDKSTKSKKDDKGDDKSKTDKGTKSANSEAATNSKVKDAGGKDIYGT
uniref:Uncharacterized protein n=1 Tax=Meloidogyne javanica TaxID=6303 RepID=A0A915MKM3_MELJA